MKKKWFRTMDLVDDAFIEEADPNRQVKSLRKRRIVTTLVASAACLALTLTSLWLFLPYDNTPPSIEQHKKNDYYAVIEKLNALKKEESEYNNNFEMIVDGVDDMVLGGFKDNMEVFTPDAMSKPSMAPGSSMNSGATDQMGDGSTYQEITDNQVEGITEADRIKRSSTHIFYLNGDTLWVYNIAGADSQKVGSVNLYPTLVGATSATNAEFYLSADCKTITVIATYRNSVKQKIAVRMASVDVSDPTNPTVKNTLEVSGSYLSSRVIDGKILLMTRHTLDQSAMDFEKEETFLPQVNGKSIPSNCILHPEVVNSARYTVVLKLDEATLTVEAQSAALSYSEHFYVSQNYIYLTHVYAAMEPVDEQMGIRNTMTEITALSYKDTFEKKGTISVCGYIKDQWSMDEYEGILRVVTTTNAMSVYQGYFTDLIPDYLLRTTSADSNASLYCVDLEEFKLLAAVKNFAPAGEDVRSVRFDKTAAYVCTAIRVTDPVYFFDLSDPTNITYKETGEISGFSTSLINMGNGYLLGIGQDGNGDFKAEIYKETDSGVESHCKYILKNSYFSQNYKSYYIDRENQLIGLGVIVNSPGAKNLYLVLHFDGTELVELLMTPLNGSNEIKRGVYIDGFMYLFGREDFKVIDVYNQPEKPEEPEKTREVDKIVDLTKENDITYETGIEFWCEDEKYQYFFGGERGRYINVYYADGSEENVLSALEKGHITIQDLDRFQIEYYVKPHK